jgi:hypothetical protein
MTDCVSCVEPENYAAVALKLQDTALHTEQCIFALEQRLRGAVNQPTLIRGASFLGLGAGVQADLTTAFVTPTFQNSDISSFATLLPRGVYQAGLYFNIIATGAVNDNTYRFAVIYTRNAYAALSVPNKFNVYETTFESNNGAGMDMMLHTVVESDGQDQVHFAAQHGNTSSTCNVTGIAWISRLSDLDAPRVVA